jgi:hypothetical protein
MEYNTALMAFARHLSSTMGLEPRDAYRLAIRYTEIYASKIKYSYEGEPPPY